MSIASLYPSINPSLLLDFANSKVLDPRITFTRTTTATYYDGVTTAKAEENLLTYSQEFDNAAWIKTNVTVTANSVAAPDGTTTADTVTQSAGTNYKIIDQVITGSAGQSYAVSVYAKAGTNNYIQLLFGGSNTDFANFDLSGAGAVGTVSGFTSGTTATITSVGNGWFRCVVSWSSLGTAFLDVSVCLIPSSTSARAATTANTNTVYLWGMQMEQRSSATAYTATTSQAITNYIPVLQTASAGQARFDHNPTTGESLGLLIEEARTNLATYSESIGAWVPQTATVQDNQAVAPNGTLTAEKVIPSSTGANRGCYTSFTASGVTTISIYVKYGGYQWVRLLGPAAANSVWFDVLNGVKGTEGSGVTGTITAVGNGWYRISVTQSQTGTSYVQVNLASADNSTSVTVATNDVFSGVFLWGAQAETGGASFATSYIPNLSTGSTTRNADAASMTGTNFSSWFNNGEGTLYGEMQRAQGAISGTNFHIATIGNSSSTGNYYKLRFEGSSTVRAGLSYTNNTEQCGFTQGTTTAGNFYKLCLGVKVNDFGFSSDNTTASTDTSGTVPIGLNQMIIGADVDGTSQIANNRIRKLAYYPIKATSAQLQALTV